MIWILRSTQLEVQEASETNQLPQRHLRIRNAILIMNHDGMHSVQLQNWLLQRTSSSWCTWTPWSQIIRSVQFQTSCCAASTWELQPDKRLLILSTWLHPLNHHPLRTHPFYLKNPKFWTLISIARSFHHLVKGLWLLTAYPSTHRLTSWYVVPSQIAIIITISNCTVELI